jgi:pimeloyl-ACP methyl ester carboxylesterase
MSTFVLVHGAWSGSFNWHLLLPLLRAAGHEVYTPCLTGLGERSHLLSRDVTLATHIADVVNALYFQDLRDVVLVGHSYAGRVVTGAAPEVADRIAHLVYLDALLPEFSAAPGPPPTEAPEPDDWLVPPVPRSLPDKVEEAWLAERRRPIPRACFTEPLLMPRPIEDYDFSLTYIKATADARENAQPERSAFWLAADRVRDNPRWRYREIATSHMVQNEQPVQLRDLLLEVIQ